ncbi:MAG: hypothetical protein WC444_06130 [Candidatus Paceibacterota bacterium]|jgi:hypothetical protein
MKNKFIHLIIGDNKIACGLSLNEINNASRTKKAVTCKKCLINDSKKIK